VQLGRAFTRRTLPTIMTVRPRILVEPALIPFVLLPGDVTGVHARQQAPLVAGSLQERLTAARLRARMPWSLDEGSGVTGIMEHLQGAAVG
jgi:hypothetical protein